jgi:hypothetical protein
MTEKKPMRAELADDYRIKCQLLLEEVIDAEEAAKLAAAEIAELRAERDRLKEALDKAGSPQLPAPASAYVEMRDERDRLKAVLKPRLNAKAIEGLQEILEAMEAMDEREAPFLKTLLDWHEAARKALGDAS